jgi:hypothetical protein
MIDSSHNYMKTTSIFGHLFDSGQVCVVPREWHLSIRALLGIKDGLAKTFAERVESHARVDPKLAEYLRNFSAEEIAIHMRSLAEVKKNF